MRSEPSERAHRNARPRNGSPSQPGLRLDGVDLRILSILQTEARMSSADLAREVALSPPGVQKRLRKLEERGAVVRIVTVRGVGFRLEDGGLDA